MRNLMKVLKYGGSMYVILVYDIKQMDKYDFVQRNVFHTCKKYLYHIQNSTYIGELSNAQITKLKNELSKYLRDNIDSCILFEIKGNYWIQKHILTKQKEENEQFL